MEQQIKLDKDSLAEFCQKHHIQRLALFGSVLGDKFTENSDVDFLVEFHPEHIPGMIRLSGMERELSLLIGRKVDMRTLVDLSQYIRDAVLQKAVVQYAAQ
jgi:predicted nucleotidyltransferase